MQNHRLTISYDTSRSRIDINSYHLSIVETDEAEQSLAGTGEVWNNEYRAVGVYGTVKAAILAAASFIDSHDFAIVREDLYRYDPGTPRERVGDAEYRLVYNKDWRYPDELDETRVVFRRRGNGDWLSAEIR